MGILEQLASDEVGQSSGAEEDARLWLLLADFLACSQSPRGEFAGVWPKGDTVGPLVLRAGITDLDDVDWRSLHHPGSVVWGPIIGLVHEGAAAGVQRAARHGYTAAATVADALGAGHRARWHVTATAGAVGAAASASTMLGLDAEGRLRAMALAATNAGGLALAARQRRGAAAFNRVAAATLGLTAARAAEAGAECILDPLEEPGGLLDVAGGEAVADVAIRRGVPYAGPRLYPASGFLQGAVSAAAALRSTMPGDLVSMRLEFSPGVLPLVDDDLHTAWWDARLCALRAWAHGSPGMSSTPSELDGQTDLVQLVAADLPPGDAVVAVRTSTGDERRLRSAPPGQETEEMAAMLPIKWREVLGVDPEACLAQAEALITVGRPAAVAGGA